MENVIYYNEDLSVMENYIRYLNRDRDLDPKELTPKQEKQLLRLKKIKK